MNEKLERRTFESGKMEVRAKDDGGKVIGGYAVVFDRLSVMLWGFKERIKPGAFADSMGDDVRALWQHDTAEVLGRTKAGSLRVWEDETGVGFEVDVPDTQTGRDAVTLIERGDVDQMSFGFMVLPDGDEWSEEEDGVLVRVVKRAKLYEVSPVTFPAYPDTSVDLVRSAPDWVSERLEASRLAEGLSGGRGCASAVNESTCGGRCTGDIERDEARARLALRKKEIELLELGG